MNNASPKTRNALDRRQMRQLEDFILSIRDELTSAPAPTRATIAARATKHLKFQVNLRNVTNALYSLDITPASPSRVSSRRPSRVLARAILHLYATLGETVPSELRPILEELTNLDHPPS